MQETDRIEAFNIGVMVSEMESTKRLDVIPAALGKWLWKEYEFVMNFLIYQVTFKILCFPNAKNLCFCNQFSYENSETIASSSFIKK